MRYSLIAVSIFASSLFTTILAAPTNPAFAISKLLHHFNLTKFEHLLEKHNGTDHTKPAPAEHHGLNYTNATPHGIKPGFKPHYPKYTVPGHLRPSLRIGEGKVLHSRSNTIEAINSTEFSFDMFEIIRKHFRLDDLLHDVNAASLNITGDGKVLRSRFNTTQPTNTAEFAFKFFIGDLMDRVFDASQLAEDALNKTFNLTRPQSLANTTKSAQPSSFDFFKDTEDIMRKDHTLYPTSNETVSSVPEVGKVGDDEKSPPLSNVLKFMHGIIKKPAAGNNTKVVNRTDVKHPLIGGIMLIRPWKTTNATRGGV